MKSILLALIITLSFNGFGYSIKVTLIDTYTNSAFSECDVRLEDDQGDLVQSLKTSDLGEVTFRNLKKNNLNLIAEDSEGRYLQTRYFIPGKRNQTLEFFMFPSPDFEKEIWLKEDSLFGKIDDVIKIDTISDVSDFTQGSYPGGKLTLKRFVFQNITYPEVSRVEGDQGKVMIEFIIELDGMISHISVRNSVTPELDQESIRLIRLMGKLIPSHYKGKPIRSRATEEFRFTLM